MAIFSRLSLLHLSDAAEAEEGENVAAPADGAVRALTFAFAFGCGATQKLKKKSRKSVGIFTAEYMNGVKQLQGALLPSAIAPVQYRPALPNSTAGALSFGADPLGAPASGGSFGTAKPEILGENPFYLPCV
eukprot:SAG11_NODE_1935_length_4036_cov_2.347219_2_plen_132_part_00